MAEKHLGHYSDLQSIHSEDALTWSVFGTVAHSDKSTKKSYVSDILKLINIDYKSVTDCHMWLWRRIPHPDTLVSGGPEIDFGIQTEKTIVFGEAKWRSRIGGSQGKKKDKDQLLLRIEFFEKYSQFLYPNIKNRIVLLVSLTGASEPKFRNKPGGNDIRCVEISWDDLCKIDSHPLAEEVQRYLAWKKIHSQIT